jgi:hypothetical protein
MRELASVITVITLHTAITHNSSGRKAGNKRQRSDTADAAPSTAAAKRQATNGKRNANSSSNGSEPETDPELARVLAGDGSGGFVTGSKKNRKRKLNQFEKLSKEDKQGVRIEEAYKSKVRKTAGSSDEAQQHDSSANSGGVRAARWYE